MKRNGPILLVSIMTAGLMLSLVISAKINLFFSILIVLYSFSLIPSLIYSLILFFKNLREINMNVKENLGGEIFVEAIVIAPVFMVLYFISEIKKLYKPKTINNNTNIEV